MGKVSAKDKAFEKERAKFRHNLREKDMAIRAKDEQIAQLSQELDEIKQELEQTKEWNERLLEYMDIPEDSLKDILAAQNTLAKFTKIEEALGTIMGTPFSRNFWGMGK